MAGWMDALMSCYLYFGGHVDSKGHSKVTTQMFHTRINAILKTFQWFSAWTVDILLKKADDEFA